MEIRIMDDSKTHSSISWIGPFITGLIMGITGVNLMLAFLMSGTTMNVTIPEVVKSGHQTFEVVIEIRNAKDQPVDFDGTIFVFGEGWGKENYPTTISEGTEVYDMHCNTVHAPDGCRFWWRGTIPPYSSVKFTLPTFSGEVPGKYDFLKVLIGTSNGPLQRDTKITITP